MVTTAHAHKLAKNFAYHPAWAKGSRRNSSASTRSQLLARHLLFSRWVAISIRPLACDDRPLTAAVAFMIASTSSKCHGRKSCKSTPTSIATIDHRVGCRGSNRRAAFAASMMRSDAHRVVAKSDSPTYLNEFRTSNRKQERMEFARPEDIAKRAIKTIRGTGPASRFEKDQLANQIGTPPAKSCGLLGA